ncbi:carboxylesterase [Penicillium concentricum]|uniref:Carboxylesterase n=1 Tax=Penicillium concentricum TaxID=293559 RepID=A0A9W9SQG2_9EURO|nr:carboxylesterase [Penicillium concentricum]KAJ5382245.1 carboxylesterase [Penicillium concentricum]
MATKRTLHHTLLGEIHGKEYSSTVEFLGVKYGTLEGKFSPPVLYNGDKSDIVDATNPGPASSSLADGMQREFSLIQQALPQPHIEQSETECLNLNITAPKATSTNLPVVVFVHGGGFMIGSNAWPQYNFRRLVDLSIQEESPIIGITINYRLGPFGFLHSAELAKFGGGQNNGLYDQRTALLWIQKYIAGFGGDPNNVTFVGESAGGVSGTQHLHSKVPLFTRLVSMGGTNLLVKPLPEIVNEHNYGQLLQSLNLQDLSPEDRVKELEVLPAERILASLSPGMAFLPSSGGDLNLPTNNFEEIYLGKSQGATHPGKSWCKQIMIGDCEMDGSILLTLLGPPKPGVFQRFKDSIQLSLGVEGMELIFQAYGITETASEEETFATILKFGNDINFLAPVLVYAHGWDSDAFIYFFNEPNTWDGPWKGHANHILDVAYLFQNYNEALTEGQRHTATIFGKDLIRFANGKAPWPVFNFGANELNARVYGSKDPEKVAARVDTIPGPSDRSERRQTIFQLSQSIPLTKLSDAWGSFMSGK